ncbi:MAG: response regulator [Armatimonadota bacterium]
MSKEKILVVDDEEDILQLVSYNLIKEGYTVSCVNSGETAIYEAKESKPDVIVLDLMLPGLDGLDVCRIMKNDPLLQQISIIILTAKGEEADIVKGLELGADDYITKPFSPKVLIARIKAVLRKNKQNLPSEEDTITIHGITIDPRRHEVVVDGEVVVLTLTEFRILHFLARRPGWVFTRYQIVEECQGSDAEVTDRSVDVHIVSLRRKLGEAGKSIITVRGVGYKMKES